MLTAAVKDPATVPRFLVAAASEKLIMKRTKEVIPATVTRKLPVSASASSVIENLECRRLLAASFDLGVNVNNGSSDVMNKGIPVLKSLGAKSVRIWFSPDFNKKSFEGPLQRAVDYGNAGFDVMLILNPSGGKVTNAESVKSWFQWATGNSSLKNAVDRWQIGNEIDHKNYWNGSFSQYVSNFLKPASEVLKSKGEAVVSASVSWNPQDVKELVNLGILNYVDYVGYHPYANGVSAVKTRVAEVKNIVAGRKPLVASEWNVRGLENNKAAWAQAVKDVFPTIRDNFAINYYFGLLNTTATNAGPGGIMNSNGSKTAFYSSLAAGMNGGGGVGTIDVPDSGNTPSGIPSVAKLSVYSADTGEKIIDSLGASGSVIDLAKLGSRNLLFVATTASGTSSVKFVLNGSSSTDNSAAYELDNKAVYAGTHTLTATPYASDNAAGTKGSTRTYKFTVKNSPSTGTVTNPPATGQPTVTKFALFNADTNKTVAGYESIDAGESLDLAKIGTSNLAIVAYTSGDADSVKFKFNGSTVIESIAPYAVFGDGPSGDLYGKKLTTGTYTITGQAFSGTNATGTAGATKAVTFYVKNGSTTGTTPTIPTIPTTSAPKVNSISLLNAATRKIISGYDNISAYRSIKISSLPTKNLIVQYNVAGSTNSVKSTAFGKTIVENDAPYTTNTWNATAGTHTIRGTPYIKDNAAGTAGSTLSLQLKFY